MPAPTPLREETGTAPLPCGVDPTPSDGGDTSATPEPVLEVDQIQGNILPGFQKDFQTFLFLKIESVPEAKRWLKALVPLIATTEDVLVFNRLFKAIRHRRGRESHAVKATWVNIALSYDALARLTAGTDSESVEAFADAAFKAGLARRSERLGDPTDASAEGNPQNWLVGGPGHEADILLLVASDDRDDLGAQVEQLEDSIYAFRAQGRPAPSGVTVIFKQHGATLPGALAGHEHFGFRDGVSQPGVRGRVSAEPTDVLTPRQNPREPQDQGKPGQDLLWPGEFVFGYAGQDAHMDVAQPGHVSGTAQYRPAPSWARNGSFVVFRRLRQDVGALHTFLHDTAAALAAAPPFVGTKLRASFLGAKIVGRWASGAPVLRAPDHDNADLGTNACANNDFEFFTPDPSLAAPAQEVPDTLPPATAADDRCSGPGQFPASPGDRPGAICPYAGHIRKAYARDDITTMGSGATDQERSMTSEQDTQTHRILRRGLPYGPVSRSTPEAPFSDAEDRGLLFVAYQTSIEHQFEFVTNQRVNNPDFRAPGAGYDLVIGQNNAVGENRRRTCTVTFNDVQGRPQSQTIATEVDWVIPTGGGYFFAPSIDALTMLSR